MKIVSFLCQHLDSLISIEMYLQRNLTNKTKRAKLKPRKYYFKKFLQIFKNMIF